MMAMLAILCALAGWNPARAVPDEPCEEPQPSVSNKADHHRVRAP